MIAYKTFYQWAYYLHKLLGYHKNVIETHSVQFLRMKAYAATSKSSSAEVLLLIRTTKYSQNIKCANNKG